jgi:hypothetical protein
LQIRVDPAAALAPGQVLFEIDLLTASGEDAAFEGQLEFVAVRDGVHNGFCLWFEAELSQGVTLDTGPLCPETHWAQTYMSFTPCPRQAGERIDVRVDFSCDPEMGYVDLRLGVGDNELNYRID